MKTNMKKRIYQLSKMCMAMGIFLYFSGSSLVFFGEPTAPLDEE